MATAVAQDISSIGHLASHLRRPVSSIHAAANRLGLSPALRINGVPHYDAASAERIAASLARPDRPAQTSGRSRRGSARG